jgi:hypothetical protein
MEVDAERRPQRSPEDFLMTPLQMFASLQPIRRLIGALLASLRRSADDRVAARHTGAHWSDALERKINDELQDYRRGGSSRFSDLT